MHAERGGLRAWQLKYEFIDHATGQRFYPPIGRSEPPIPRSKLHAVTDVPMHLNDHPPTHAPAQRPRNARATPAKHASALTHAP